VASSGRNAGAAIAPRRGIRGALGFLYRGERECARAHGEGGRGEGEERRGEEMGGGRWEESPFYREARPLEEGV